VPKIEKKEVIQSSAVFIVTALFAFWLDSRTENARARFADDISVAKVEQYHKTAQAPAK
jgi:hypothetical protein